VCTCGVEGVVKDGATVRVSAMMMDSAGGGGNGQADHEQRVADGWKVSDAAYQTMLDRDRNEWKGSAQQTDVADSIKEASDDAYAQAFADAKAAGWDNAAAKAEASYQAMKHREGNAWRG
jgi:flagellar biosynthesis/type III secretory pathway protein FliH